MNGGIDEEDEHKNIEMLFEKSLSLNDGEEGRQSNHILDELFSNRPSNFDP
jgi:hypothetical protein